jgi:CRISPR type III-B/RAMP module-associated protein Cmr5
MKGKVATPEQRRAKDAWEKTDGLIGQNAKDFATQCKQTSAHILNSGLLPALAFMNAKVHDKEGDKSGPSGKMKRCMDALVSWLPRFVGISSNTDVKPLLEKLINEHPAVLRRAQTEALAYLEWLARFAEGRAIESNSNSTEGGAL